MKRIYVMIPFVAHRDPIVKLGHSIEQIQDNMTSFLREYYDWPEDYSDQDLTIHHKIKDHTYTSVDELIKDCEETCIGYAIQSYNK